MSQMIASETSNPKDDSDQELLVRYINARDEQAFSGLLNRYHGIVLAVCRRVLRDRHDAEDAFQATFLVLARSAGKIRKRQSLASWLYGVAYRISVRLNRQRSQRPIRPLEAPVMVADDPFETLTRQHEQEVMHEELNRLPEKMRAPTVLRYLLGRSNREIAQELHLSESAVEGRLKRARKQLRIRLSQHGVTLGMAVLALDAARRTTGATAPATLVDRTLCACLAPHDAAAGASGPVLSERAIVLAKEEVVAMAYVNTSKALLLGICTVALIGVGVGFRVGGPQALGDEPNAVRVVDRAVASTIDDGAKATVLISTGGIAAANGEAAPLAADTNDDGAGTSSATRFFDLKKRSPSELKIHRVMNEPLTDGVLDFADTPLKDVCDIIASYYGIQILIDERALEDAALDRDLPVNGQFRDMSLRSALRFMFNRLGLECVVTSEVLLVTTEEGADNIVDTRLYPCNDQWGIDAEELAEQIKKSVEPETWDEVGGNGYIGACAGGLVVRQTPRVHEKINDLLGQFSALVENRGRDRR